VFSFLVLTTDWAQGLITPDQLLSRIEPAYRRVAAYSDSILVYDVEAKPWKVIDRASVRFSDRGKLRFAYEEQGSGISMAANQRRGQRLSKKFTYHRTRTRSNADLSFAYAIASLVISGEELEKSAPFESVTREVIMGQPCLRLYVGQGGWQTFVWADARTYLVKKARVKWEGKMGSGDEVYFYHPKVTYRSP
jgi:hypothetical protein